MSNGKLGLGARRKADQFMRNFNNSEMFKDIPQN